MAPAGQMERARANLAALTVLRNIQAAGRAATADEQRVLARWSGWGALPLIFDDRPARASYDSDDAHQRAVQRWDAFSEIREQVRALLSDAEWKAASRTALNAHYTDAAFVREIWDAVRMMGFEGGTVLEPGSGLGNFIGLAPEDLDIAFTGVERDPTTAAISQLLYPDATIINAPLQDVVLSKDSFDAAVGNVPFGRFRPYDPDYNPDRTLSIHDLFLLKALASTRPGGVVALITSRYTLDAVDPGARQRLYELGDLVGAVRLPATAHRAAAGTDVVTDVVFLRRRAENEPPGDDTWLRTEERVLDGRPEPVRVNAYFDAHPEHVLGQLQTRLGQFGPELTVVSTEETAEGIAAQLGAAARDIASRAARHSGDLDARDAEQAEPVAFVRAEGAAEGSLGLDASGAITVVSRGRPVPLEVHPEQRDQLVRLIELKGKVRALYDAEAATTTPGETAELGELRRQVREAYRAYRKRYPPLSKPRQARIFTPKEAAERAKREGLDKVPAAWRQPTAFGLIEDDPDATLLFSLEGWNEQTGEAEEQPILTRRMIEPRVLPERADSVEEAIALALEHDGGNLDMARVASLLGVDVETAIHRVGTLAFRNPYPDLSADWDAAGALPAMEAGAQATLADRIPSGPPTNPRWEPRVQYLSGDVRTKLAQAREAAKWDPSYAANVAALEQVQPPDLTPSEIKAKVGAPWIPTVDYTQFLRDLGFEHAEVRHAGGTVWEVKGANSGDLAVSEWGTPERSAQELFETLLKQAESTIRVTYRDHEGNIVVDRQKTEAAREKARLLAQEFEDWVWRDEARAQRLTRIYNETFNRFVLPEYDTSPLTLPRARLPWPLRPHQNAAVRRIVSSPTVLLSHVVGAGKTATMVAAAMEMRRTGLVRKPAMVVPNHMLKQFTREFRELYPNAKLLAINASDLHHSRRAKFLARVAGSDWDAVILTHEAFNRLPVRPSTERAYMDAELALLRSQLERARQTGMADRTLKQIENSLEAAEARIKEALDKTSENEGVFFEDTGIDYLFLDEAHAYKNLRTVSAIPGATIQGSNKATKLHMVLEHLRSKSRTGRVATLATGTIPANSVTEAYVVMRYLAPQLLRSMGLEVFDNWAATFGEVVTAIEPDPKGAGYVQKARFSRFFNVPEFMRAYKTFADVQLAEDLNLPRPPVRSDTEGQRGEVVVVPSTQAQRDYIKSLPNQPWINDDGGVLKALGLGLRASLDMRLVGGSEEQGSKLDHVAEKVAEIWEEHKDVRYPVSFSDPTLQELPGALQLVFLDEGVPGSSSQNPVDLYADLRDKLVERGVPREAIRFIHEAKNDLQKEKLFADARAGRVAVLIGSTEKMGTGTNVQDRAVALHHVSYPWRPADMGQRDGRIERQGNLNHPDVPGTPDDIRIIYYVTERTFDEFRLTNLTRKAKFIGQIQHRDFNVREIEDLSSEAVNLSLLNALASGDPTIMEHAQATAERSRLQTLARSWDREQDRRARQIAEADAFIQEATTALEGMRAAAATRTPTAGDRFSIVLQGTRYTLRDTAASALGRVLTDLAKDTTLRPGERVPLGQLGGQDFHAEIAYGVGGARMVRLRFFWGHVVAPGHRSDRAQWHANKITPDSGRGALQALENFLNQLDADIVRLDAEVQKQRERRAEAAANLRDKSANPYRELARSKEREEQLLGQLIIANEREANLTEQARGYGDDELPESLANDLSNARDAVARLKEEVANERSRQRAISERDGAPQTPASAAAAPAAERNAPASEAASGQPSAESTPPAETGRDSSASPDSAPSTGAQADGRPPAEASPPASPEPSMPETRQAQPRQGQAQEPLTADQPEQQAMALAITESTPSDDARDDQTTGEHTPSAPAASVDPSPLPPVGQNPAVATPAPAPVELDKNAPEPASPDSSTPTPAAAEPSTKPRQTAARLEIGTLVSARLWVDGRPERSRRRGVIVAFDEDRYLVWFHGAGEPSEKTVQSCNRPELLIRGTLADLSPSQLRRWERIVKRSPALPDETFGQRVHEALAAKERAQTSGPAEPGGSPERSQQEDRPTASPTTNAQSHSVVGNAPTPAEAPPPEAVPAELTAADLEDSVAAELPPLTSRTLTLERLSEALRNIGADDVAEVLPGVFDALDNPPRDEHWFSDVDRGVEAFGRLHEAVEQALPQAHGQLRWWLQSMANELVVQASEVGYPPLYDSDLAQRAEFAAMSDDELRDQLRHFNGSHEHHRLLIEMLARRGFDASGTPTAKSADEPRPSQPRVEALQTAAEREQEEVLPPSAPATAHPSSSASSNGPASPPLEQLAAEPALLRLVLAAADGDEQALGRLAGDLRTIGSADVPETNGAANELRDPFVAAVRRSLLAGQANEEDGFGLVFDEVFEDCMAAHSQQAGSAEEFGLTALARRYFADRAYRDRLNRSARRAAWNLIRASTDADRADGRVSDRQATAQTQARSANPESTSAPAVPETSEGVQMPTQSPPVAETPTGPWSARIRIDDTGPVPTVTGTRFEDTEFRKVLHDHGFEWRKRRGLWEYIGDPANKDKAVAAIRAAVAEFDRAALARESKRGTSQARESKRFPPTAQQQAIIDAAVAGQNVAVQALAGAGKTSTLRMIASALPPDTRILYVAFNRTIAEEARQSFPRNVLALTSHALARRALLGGPYANKIRHVGKGLRFPEQIASFLNLTPLDYVGPGGQREVLEPPEQAQLAMAVVKNFRESADFEISEAHLPDALSSYPGRHVAKAVLATARRIWDNIADPSNAALLGRKTPGAILFDHDDYLKLYQLSRPRIDADVIFFDEAQDINDVRRYIVQSQPTQTIVVGDSYQAIYEFTGAKDALVDWPADVTLPLTKSWRFGPAVAEVGNHFLRLLGSPNLLEGNPAMDSTIGVVENPDAILCRTNVGAVSAVLEGMEQGKRVALVGGGAEVAKLAKAAKSLKAGRGTNHPELSRFRRWEQVVEAAQEDRNLQTFVSLIENYGPDRLLEMVDQLVDEDATGASAPDLVVSTAHKAKGREWDYVRIGDDFLAPEYDVDGRIKSLPPVDQLRLSYVAVTRGRRRTDLGSLSWIEAVARGIGSDSPAISAGPQAEAAAGNSGTPQSEPTVAAEPSTAPAAEHKADAPTVPNADAAPAQLGESAEAEKSTAQSAEERTQASAEQPAQLDLLGDLSDLTQESSPPSPAADEQEVEASTSVNVASSATEATPSPEDASQQAPSSVSSADAPAEDSRRPDATQPSGPGPEPWQGPLPQVDLGNPDQPHEWPDERVVGRDGQAPAPDARYVRWPTPPRDAHSEEASTAPSPAPAAEPTNVEIHRDDDSSTPHSPEGQRPEETTAPPDRIDDAFIDVLTALADASAVDEPAVDDQDGGDATGDDEPAPEPSSVYRYPDLNQAFLQLKKALQSDAPHEDIIDAINSAAQEATGSYDTAPAATSEGQAVGSAASAATRVDLAAAPSAPAATQPPAPVEEVLHQPLKATEAALGDHADTPEWQRIKAVAEASRNLGHTLADAAGSYARELWQDIRTRGLLRVVAIRSARTIATVAYKLANSLDRGSDRAVRALRSLSRKARDYADQLVGALPAGRTLQSRDDLQQAWNDLDQRLTASAARTGALGTFARPIALLETSVDITQKAITTARDALGRLSSAAWQRIIAVWDGAATVAAKVRQGVLRFGADALTLGYFSAVWARTCETLSWGAGQLMEHLESKGAHNTPAWQAARLLRHVTEHTVHRLHGLVPPGEAVPVGTYDPPSAHRSGPQAQQSVGSGHGAAPSTSPHRGEHPNELLEVLAAVDYARRRGRLTPELAQVGALSKQAAAKLGLGERQQPSYAAYGNVVRPHNTAVTADVER